MRVVELGAVRLGSGGGLVGKNQVSRKHSGGTHACKIKSGKGVATRGGENAAVEKRNTWQAAGRQQAAGSRQVADR